MTPLRRLLNLAAVVCALATPAQAQTLRIATIGDLDAALAQLSIDDRLIPVRVQLADVAREDRCAVELGGSLIADREGAGCVHCCLDRACHGPRVHALQVRLHLGCGR